MKNNKGLLRRILFSAGVVLLIAAVAIVVIDRIETGRFQIDCNEVADYLENVIPQRIPGIKEERSSNEMPSALYDGYEYSAILYVPRASIKVPVCSSWSTRAVKKVPCRFYGSAYNGTLIIGGTDQAGQFGFISNMDVGDSVSIVDMKGFEFRYTVSAIKHSDNADSNTLMTRDYDLTLFVKDKQSGDWILVRCNMY